MSSDKLNLAVRAAGFAMACDESVGGPVKPAQQALPASDPAASERKAAVAVTSTVLGSLKSAKASFAWGTVGWSFGKTA